MKRENPTAVRFSRQEKSQLTEHITQLKSRGLKITFNAFVREAVKEKLARSNT